MRKRILAFVFAAALLVALAVPLFGGGTAQATTMALTASGGGKTNCVIVPHEVVSSFR